MQKMINNRAKIIKTKINEIKIFGSSNFEKPSELKLHIFCIDVVDVSDEAENEIRLVTVVVVVVEVVSVVGVDEVWSPA